MTSAEPPLENHATQARATPSSRPSAQIDHPPGQYFGPTRPIRPGPPISSTSDWTGYTDRRVAYDDFTTIDWIHDFTKDRLRAQALRRVPGWRGLLLRAFSASQAWIIVLLVGLCTGWIAGIIDITSNWLSDVKEGYCSAGFYLSRKFCCWHRPENEYCSEWISWSSALGLSSPFFGWMGQCAFYTAWGVVFAVCAASLVKSYAPYASGEGVPEIKTILGGFVIRKFLGMWTLLIKCVGLVFSVGSGLSLGKEGPLVHVACCLGNIFPRLFTKFESNEAKKREILSASSAAGISCAFGSPIGGVLFSLEEISYYFPFKTMWRSFFCAMVGAISLKLINPFRTEKLVWFQVQFSRDWHAFELPVFVLLGIIGGLSGTAFIRLNTRVQSIRKATWINDRPILEVAIVALITGIVGWSHVFLRAPTVDLVANLFRECADVGGDFHGLCNKTRTAFVVLLLFFAAIIKFGLTVITYGIMVPAGLFTPTIAVGACVGRAFGIMMQALQESYPNSILFWSCNPNSQCVTPATYSVVGAAAFLSGTTRITVSVAIIMFELTGALSYVLPIIITVLTAKWVGDAHGKGIYDWLIRLGGYPFLDGGEEYIGKESVEDIMTDVDDLEVIPAFGMNVDTLSHLLTATSYKGFPVVESKENLRLIGYAGREELRYALSEWNEHAARDLPSTSISTPIWFSETDLDQGGTSEDESNHLDMRPWIQTTPTILSPSFPVELCVELFKKMGTRYALVTENGRLRGIVTKKDLLQHGKLVWF
ncbi:chloride channel [Zopfochytrium polystomum]|nr:chloride channel [Zopfochytrium polystomum]